MPRLAKNTTLKWPQAPSGPEPARKRSNPARTKARKRSKDPTEGLLVANPNAAAIDVGCAEHWVCVPAGRAEKSVQKFGCCTAELNRLADLLVECRVDTVVMEATGNYWVVLYDLLEERRLHPVLVNPR